MRGSGLQRLFSTFPGGWPGIGLLLLRLAIGISAMVEQVAYLAGHADLPPAAWVIGGLAAASGLLLVIGFLTPIAGVLLVVCIGAGRLAGFNETGTSPLLVAIAAIAIVLLGPGAVSLDARLFGRREIIIPRGSSRAKS